MLMVEIEGDDVGSLIGPRGDALNAMQYMVRLMAGNQLQRRVNVTLDIAGYRERRRQALNRLAERMAQKALERNRPVTLEPMSPAERRVVHMTLRSSEKVYTGSIGEGNRRRVRIYPQGYVEEAQDSGRNGNNRRGRPNDRRRGKSPRRRQTPRGITPPAPR